MEATVFHGLPEHASIKENAYQNCFKTKLYFCYYLGISVLVKLMTYDFDVLTLYITGVMKLSWPKGLRILKICKIFQYTCSSYTDIYKSLNGAQIDFDICI